jgi:hypothetical protein
MRRAPRLPRASRGLMSSYHEFLAGKRRRAQPVGPPVDPGDIHPLLHDWQARIVEWAIRQGRAAIFADCGLGKTFMQLEWARLIADRSLILAPLSVARQTVRESHKIGVDCRYARHGHEVTGPGVWVTNYEMADQFDPGAFGAVVLDESSILKNVEGRTRQRLTEAFRPVPYRLACTATPAPNDVAELCNHAEFLGVMPRNEMLAAFFVHDEIGWRPKGHAAGPMFEWMATWSVAVRRPSDLGYDDTGYDLPPLIIHAQPVAVGLDAAGQLFPTELGGIGGRAKVRRATLDARCERAAVLCAGADQWVIWCGLNSEASLVATLVEGSVNVEGSWSPDAKAEALEAFQDGDIRVLVTKPSIAGFGMNFQNAHRMAFVGLSDSYEAYYQAIRRCWRFGQQHPVEAHVIVSTLEHQIVDNVRQKETEAAHVTAQLVRYSPIRKEGTDDRPAAIPHRRTPRRMLASTTRR